LRRRAGHSICPIGRYPFAELLNSVALDRRALHLVGDQGRRGAGLLERHLHAGCPLRPVHPHEGFADRATDGEQTVVAQHEDIVIGEIAHDRLALGVVGRDAFVAVIAGVGDDGEPMLGQRQQAALLGRHRRAGRRMRVYDASRLGARHVDRAVDDKSGRVDGIGRGTEDRALGIDLDQG
jgi:hypothetical protein